MEREKERKKDRRMGGGKKITVGHALKQWLKNFSSKRSERKYVKLCEPCGFCSNYLTVSLWHKIMPCSNKTIFIKMTSKVDLSGGLWFFGHCTRGFIYIISLTLPTTFGEQ